MKKHKGTQADSPWSAGAALHGTQKVMFYRAGEERKLTGLENGFSGSQRGVRDHFEHEKE